MVVVNALPGPKGFLGINNILELRQKGLLGTLHGYWQEYGDLFEINVGPKKIIVVLHPEHVRHVTMTHSDNYEKLHSYDPVRKYIIGNGVVTSTGELWKRQRRLMAPFYTPRGVQAFADIMLRDTIEVAERWERLAQTQPDVEMFDEMAMITASIILKAVFSTETEEDILKIKDSVETLVAFTGERQGMPFMLPDWLPTARNKKYWQARNLTYGYINNLLDERLEMDESAYPDDLLTRLIQAEDPETGERMSRDLLLDESLTNFFAGYETSARTMSYAWYALAKNPEVQAKLHEELDRELGSEPPTLETLKRLPYTLRVVKETLRLYPPAPVYAKDVVDEDVIDGYKIPKGSMIMVAPYLTHRHPDFWEDPLRFDPDRHTPEATKARHSQAYHPFGAGQRICLGNHFSLLETHIILALLGRRFAPSLPADYKANFVMKGILHIDNGLPMTLNKRDLP